MPNLTVHSVAGQSRPVVLFGASDGVDFDGSATNGTVGDLEIDQAGGGVLVSSLSVAFGGTVDDVIARGSATLGSTCFFRDVTVTNAVCMTGVESRC